MRNKFYQWFIDKMWNIEMYNVSNRYYTALHVVDITYLTIWITKYIKNYKCYFTNTSIYHRYDYYLNVLFLFSNGH